MILCAHLGRRRALKGFVGDVPPSHRHSLDDTLILCSEGTLLFQSVLLDQVEVCDNVGNVNQTQWVAILK
jgi:hypothetical protein